MKPRTRPAPDGTGDDDITEFIQQIRTGPHDGTTVEWPAPEPAYFGGASGTGLMELEAPAAPPPSRVRRPADEAMFVRTKDGPGLLCGLCLWRRHTAPHVQRYAHIFDALRASAATAEPVPWRPDAVGRWICPACQNSPLYWPRHTPRHSAPAVRQAKTAGRPVRPPDEFGLEVIAEQAALERLHASRSRTATLIRPDGTFYTARITTGTGEDYRPRHRTVTR